MLVMSTQWPILDALAEKVLIFDGAMGTQIQGAHLKNEDFILRDGDHLPEKSRAAAQRLNGELLDGCNEILCFTRPDVIEAIHTRYMEAGADLIETNTFGTTSIVLGEYNISELDYELSLQAARIARRAADKVSTTAKPRFVVGALGPGTKLVSLGNVDWAELETTYTAAFTG